MVRSVASGIHVHLQVDAGATPQRQISSSLAVAPGRIYSVSTVYIVIVHVDKKYLRLSPQHDNH